MGCRRPDCDFGLGRSEPLAVDRRKGDHLHILKIGTPFVCGTGQVDLHLSSARDVGRGAGQVAHRLLRFNPRTARLAPARAVENADLDAQLRGFFQRCVHHLPPLFAVKFERTFARLTVLESDVADESTVDADALHGFQIAAYAVGADVVRDPVPVNRCLYRVGCFGEARRQLLSGDGFSVAARCERYEQGECGK